IDGSTIISYYLPNDFDIKSSLKEYFDEAYFGTEQGRREIELKVNMGDHLLTKKDCLGALVLHRIITQNTNLNIDWSEDTVKHLIAQAYNDNWRLRTPTIKQDRDVKIDQAYLDEIIELHFKENRTYEEDLYYNNVINLVMLAHNK